MDITALQAAALTVRSLSMDGVQKAASGHPGLPMGCAELGALLFGEIMQHNPEDPSWMNRDRFVLSAGHGSMLLYSLLHVSGYDLPLEELKNFRQVGSKTPGHPEYGFTPGVETTTGPLGAGLATAVGMAIAETMLASRFNTPLRSIIDHFTYVIAGDGCMMEGIASEAASLAGHLGLGKLIVFYDSNSITIEGSTDLAFTEDTAARYQAYGWQTLHGDAYDMEGIADLVKKAGAEKEKPSLIVLKSVIGKGSPNMAGSHKVHGAPLGEEEIRATRVNLGIPENEAFYVHPQAAAYFRNKRIEWSKQQREWNDSFKSWASENPDLKKEWDRFFQDPEFLSPGSSGGTSSAEFPAPGLPVYSPGDKEATRSSSGKTIKALSKVMPNLVGGSADLAPSNNTDMPGCGEYSKTDRTGRVLHFGVRENAMGAVANGIALYGGLRPFCATFLVFADYMRPPLRLAALMGIPLIAVFTHDSFHVGEDGPTHQPIEQIASLRIIPNFRVLRPGDPQETVEAWLMALERKGGPTALILTRQGLTVYPKYDRDWKKNCRKGAYIVQSGTEKPEIVIIATGSEVNMALEAASLKPDLKIRVVSMISRELFLSQPESFRQSIIPEGVRTITVEAGVRTGWEGIASSAEDIFSIDRFGESGPGDDVAEALGFTPGKLAEIL